MKVLTIISKLEMGGIEKTLLSCLPYLKAHDVHISVLCDEGGKLQPEYERQGVKIIDFNGYKKPFLDAKRLRQVLKSEKFDIVHSRYGHTSGVFAKVCREFGVPMLVSIHNEKAMFRNGWEGRPILGQVRKAYLAYHKKMTYKYATYIIGHSKANLDYYNDVPDRYQDKIKVLYNGVDFSKFDDNPKLPKTSEDELDRVKRKASKIFIHIGKFKEQKNHSFMIDVFNRLEPRDNNYFLLLLGEGPLRLSMEAKVRELGLEQHVIFAGMQTNIAPYLYNADVFLFPSIYEGFGNVLIEAQYARLAVSASGIPPHYEATYVAYQKFFFDPYDIDDAEQKVKSILNSELEDVKNEAYGFAASFSIENMVNNLVNIYKSV